MLPKGADDVGIPYASMLKEAGFDYIELPAAQAALLNDPDIREILSVLRELDLPVHACNNFFGPGIKLVGEKVDKAAVRDAYWKTIETAAELGAGILVLGSPWAKTVPEGYSYAKAFDQLAEWCSEIGPAAEKRGLLVALEPNNHTETNMINTYSEAAELALAVNHPAVRCLQDFYHMRVENDHSDTLLKYSPDLLVHTHFARLDGRGFPMSDTEDPEYRKFFHVLHKMGYEGGVSMEGFPKTVNSLRKEAEETCRLLKTLAAE